jgi:hypothetical protein
MHYLAQEWLLKACVRPERLPRHLYDYLVQCVDFANYSWAKAPAGRPGLPAAGERVQGLIDGGMDKRAARKKVHEEMQTFLPGVQRASIARAHNRHLKTKKEED